MTVVKEAFGIDLDAADAGDELVAAIKAKWGKDTRPWLSFYHQLAQQVGAEEAELQLLSLWVLVHGELPEGAEIPDIEGTETRSHLGLSRSPGPGVKAAGLAVVAADTGRVLMLQRALDEDDPAAGSWEMPGGTLDPGEDPLTAAKREWREETGCELPDGELVGEWHSGPYCGYVWRVGSEDDVEVFGDRDDVSNPDDPDGDLVEALAWWDPAQLTGSNPALREELRHSVSKVLAAIAGASQARGHVNGFVRFDEDQLRIPEGPDAGQWMNVGLGRMLTNLFPDGETLVVDEFTHDKDTHVTVFSSGEVVLSQDRFGQPGERDVLADYLTPESCREIADHIDDMASDAEDHEDDGSFDDTDFDEVEATLVDYKLASDGDVVVGYNPNGEVVVGWAKPGAESPDPGQLRRDFTYWTFDPDEARRFNGFGDKLKDAADRADEGGEEEVDTYHAGGEWDVARFADHSIGFLTDEEAGVELSGSYAAMRQLFDELAKMHEVGADRPGKPSHHHFGAFDYDVDADGNVTVKGVSAAGEATFGAGTLEEVLSGLDEALDAAGYDGRRKYLPPELAYPARSARLMAVSIVDTLIGDGYSAQQRAARTQWMGRCRGALVRHPAPPPHEQWMHAGGSKKLVSAAKELSAKAEAKPASKKVARTPSKSDGNVMSGLSANDLFRESGRGEPSDKQQAAIRKVFEGTFAGFLTRDLEIGHTDRQIEIDGQVYDSNGGWVGHFNRVISKDRAGKLVAENRVIELDPQAQGQGFAKAFDVASEAWYRQQGFDRIEFSSMDVGGFANARRGGDFRDEGGASNVAATLGGIINGGSKRIPPERMAEQKRLGQDMLERLRKPFGSEDYPTAYEVSDVGRWPGAGRADWWIGKEVMMTSSWAGVKPL